MLQSFFIVFRETLEAALIIGIVWSYLSRTNQTHYHKTVLIGIAAAIVASIGTAFIFNWYAGGFEGQSEYLFEGVTMLVGALLLTTMILWMMRQKQVTRKLEEQVETQVSQARNFGLFALIFIAILREGVETVIFIAAAQAADGAQIFLGSSIGLVLASLLGYMIFWGSTKINLKLFFDLTSIVLILFAAGLVAHGVHELQEAGVVPILAEHLWDLNPEINPDGSYPPMHEKGAVMIFFRSLFGYNGNPSLLEVISYWAYLLPVLWIFKKNS